MDYKLHKLKVSFSHNMQGRTFRAPRLFIREHEHHKLAPTCQGCVNCGYVIHTDTTLLLVCCIHQQLQSSTHLNFHSHSPPLSPPSPLPLCRFKLRTVSSWLQPAVRGEGQ